MTSPTGSISGHHVLLEVEHLTVEFTTPQGVLRAVDDVSFTLDRGERLAIVGESGSGKSVMSMALMRMVAHPGRITSGSITLEGRDVLGLSDADLRAVRGGDAAMVFQDPMTSLNPVARVSDQMVRPLRQHLGLTPEAARARAVALLAATGIPDPERNVDAYPHELSGGMRQRVMIALAISCEPSLLIADEPTTALDVTVQAQIVEMLKRIAAGETATSIPRARWASTIDDRVQRTSVIFVTHDMGLVAQFADRVAVMYGGRIVESGPAAEIFADPRHPYTQGLLRSIPSIEGALPDRLAQIPGVPPNLAALGPGCSFAPRCPHSMRVCEESVPALIPTGPARDAACWLETAESPMTPATVPIRLEVAHVR
ncbi:MAG: ABC transporter ATP-binding protein [Dehalococcoidia bacterium]|nr:MAG: ABC transporter ATP-binding protein [Dehalococcoidia bacterium]